MSHFSYEWVFPSSPGRGCLLQWLATGTMGWWSLLGWWEDLFSLANFFIRLLLWRFSLALHVSRPDMLWAICCISSLCLLSRFTSLLFWWTSTFLCCRMTSCCSLFFILSSRFSISASTVGVCLPLTMGAPGLGQFDVLVWNKDSLKKYYHYYYK